MSNNKKYQRTVHQILNSVNRIKAIKDEKTVDNPYVDEYTTDQQRARDKEITTLLQLYVKAYEYKNKSNKLYKGILFGACVGILIAFTTALIILVNKLSISSDNTSVEAVVQLVSVCITFLTLIVGILKIITKYVFPVNDEAYITRIVELIQNNDLENKKENIKVKSIIIENKENKSNMENDIIKSFDEIN